MRVDMGYKPARPTKTQPLLVAVLHAVAWTVEHGARLIRETADDIHRYHERTRR